MGDSRSYYDDRGDPPRRYKSSRTRPREEDDPDYMEESTYIERGKGRGPRDLVPSSRGRDRDDSVEEIQRDFPPPRSRRPRSGYDDSYDDGPRRARSAAGDRRDRDRYDRDRDRDRYDRGGNSRYSDDHDDWGPAAGGAAAGAAAGYGASRSRGGGDRSARGGDRDRDRDRDRGGGRDRDRDYGRDRNGYYSDDRSPPRRERKKSGLEGALEGLGLGGIVGALAGGKGGDRDRSRSGSRSRGGRDRYDGRGDPRDRGSSRGKPTKETRNRQWAQAAQAALVAGAIEAFKSRGEPGPWTGAKGKRVATAALGAGGIDKLVDKDPDKKSHKHLFEAVIGGLAANRLANGPSGGGDKDKDERGRSRSRSRTRSIIDRFRSKSRGGSADGSNRERSASAGGERKSGGKGDALKDLAAGGTLAAAGKKIFDSVRSRSRKRRSPSAGSEDSYEPPSRSRRRDRDVGQNNPRSRSKPPDETAVVGPQQRKHGGTLAAGATAGAVAAGVAHKAGTGGSETEDSQSSTEMEHQHKKMRGKEILTAGLASVATIHAAHAVYQSMEASTKRHKQVEDGTMSVEEARKKRSKAWLQDAAAVGIAALGIKGAYSEWKEMNEQRHSVKEIEERRKQRRKRREKRLRDEARMNGAAPGGGQYMSGGAGPPSDRYGAPPSGYLPPPPMGNDRR